ncbi:hypothetical protein P8A21_03530 [Streptomyces poriferorum]|uniref:hypothetical protein n=1 Tax=Streptomyces poriferorum TaxID=2798799 RepID=UPI00273F9B31|nr:hypothetical protein [Streptomyces sp. Alt1]WLQ46628.1 hypothetical protein P8A21_03530 [Streptomyces sp. Alt1]
MEEADMGGLTARLPLVDGAERLGVVAVVSPTLDALLLRRARVLASLLAMMITSKRSYKDLFPPGVGEHRAPRRRDDSDVRVEEPQS